MTLEGAWRRVIDEAARLSPIHLRQLFADNNNRFDDLSATLDDLTIDFSKEKLDAEALGVLIDLARVTEVEIKRPYIIQQPVVALPTIEIGELVALIDRQTVPHPRIRRVGQGRRAAPGFCTLGYIEHMQLIRNMNAQQPTPTASQFVPSSST